MTIRIIYPRQWLVQKWQNGGGITNEIFSKSDEHGIVWRLSIAEVSSNGPFSIFPGIDRIIVLLQGNGFKLNFTDSNAQHILQQQFVPFKFSGETKTNCELIRGPVRDFNVMTRHTELATTFKVIKLVSQEQLKLSTENVIIFVASGVVLVTINEEGYRLENEETLIISDQKTDLGLSVVTKEAVIFLIYMKNQ